MAETPALYEDQYEIKAGRWRKSTNELVLTLNADRRISDYTLYAMGSAGSGRPEKILQRMQRTRRQTWPTDYGSLYL